MAFIILPLFALANTGIVFASGWASQLTSKNSIGIILGLVAGKPIGVLLLAYTAVKLKLSSLAEDINWKQITGAGILGGIGFTMSVFITLLAYNDGPTIVSSKIAVLFSSLFAGIVGFIVLKISIKNIND